MASFEKPHFSILDYTLFAASLIFSLLVGFYYGLVRRQKQTTREILFAGGKLGALPVAMTLVATFMSAISLLGYPAEIYQFGTMFYYYGLMYFIAYPMAAFIFLPVLYRLKLPSLYSYLEMRFDSKVRSLASFIFCLQTTLYLSVGLYAPALTLNSVTDFPLWASVLATGFVCVLYTSVGGAKTVVWTNVYQFFLIIGGLLAVVITGLRYVGSYEKVWELNRQGGRIYFGDFDPDPRVRHSFWSLMIGGTFTLLTLYCANQMAVQRYMSMKSLKEAQIAILLNIPFNLILISLYTVIGLILFASFYGCDPNKAGLVKKADEILPHFVMNNLSHLKGLPGIFVSAIYGAGLSTVASGLNSLSAVVLEDFVKPFHNCFSKKSQMQDKSAAIICRLLTFCFGICIIFLAYVFTWIKAPILQIALSLFGVCGGPILGVFCLGIFFKRPNAHGALIGLLASACITSLLGLSPIFSRLAPVPLPLSTDNCSSYFQANYNATFTGSIDLLELFNASNAEIPANFTFVGNLSTTGSTPFESSNFAKDDHSFWSQFRHLSYQYYSLFAVLVVISIGYPVSLICDLFCQKTSASLSADSKDENLRIKWNEVFSCSYGLRSYDFYSVPGTNASGEAIPMK